MNCSSIFVVLYHFDLKPIKNIPILCSNKAKTDVPIRSMCPDSPQVTVTIIRNNKLSIKDTTKIIKM